MAYDPHVVGRVLTDPIFSSITDSPEDRLAWHSGAPERDEAAAEARRQAAAFLARNERHAKHRRSAAVEAAILREEAAELSRSNAIAQAFAKAFARDHKR